MAIYQYVDSGSLATFSFVFILLLFVVVVIELQNSIGMHRTLYYVVYKMAVHAMRKTSAVESDAISSALRSSTILILQSMTYWHGGTAATCSFVPCCPRCRLVPT